MKLTNLVSVGAAGLLAMGAVALGPATANAATNTVEDLKVTNAIISGKVVGKCDAGQMYVALGSANGKPQAFKVNADGSFKVSSTYGGDLQVQGACDSYNGKEWQTEAYELKNVPSELQIDPESWKEGDKVTVTSAGFKAVETVTMKMVRDGKEYHTWTATADAEGVVTFENVVFPFGKGVLEGTYELKATSPSGHTAWGSFYWGQPSDDTDNGNGDDNGNGNGDGDHDGGDHNGLPHTGN